MPGLGTLINVALIVVGGLAGLLGGRLITERVQDGLIKAAAVSVMFIGIAGALEQMLAVNGPGLTSGGTATIVISLAGGALIGELLDLEGLFERLGRWLRRVSGNEGNSTFLDAFLTATLTVCIGAMAIVGSISDGIAGDWSTLALKGALDALIICVMTASMGVGCIFSALPVAVLQGSVTALARLIQPLMTAGALANLSMVGSIDPVGTT